MSSGEKRPDTEPDSSTAFNAQALQTVLQPLLQYLLTNSVIFGLWTVSKLSPVTSSGKYLKRFEVQQIYKFDNGSVTFWGTQNSG